MSWAQRRLLCFVLFVLWTIATPLAASPVSDFGARLAQTVWSLQQVEGILRSQPLSSVPVPTPEALASYLELVSENINALTAISSQRVTDEQQRVMAGGLKSVVALLKDEISLAGNRGLTTVGAALGSLETTCRSALGRF